MSEFTLKSPGIEIFESEIVATSPDQVVNPAGIVVNSTWGPLNKLVYCANKTELFKTFGLISSTTIGKSLMSAENFLDYSNGVYVYRTAPNTPEGTAAGNEFVSYAVDAGDQIAFNETVLGTDPKVTIAQGTGSYFAARHAGSTGNNIQVFLYSYTGARNLLDGTETDIYALEILEKFITNVGTTKANLLKYFGRVENDAATIETQKWLMIVTENGNLPDPLYSKGRPSGLYIREYAFVESQTATRADTEDFIYQEYVNDNFKLITARRGLVVSGEEGPLGVFDDLTGEWASGFATFNLSGAQDTVDTSTDMVKAMGKAYDVFIDDNLELEYIISLPYETVDVSKTITSYPPSADEPLADEDLYTWAICKSIYASIMSKRSITLFSPPKSMLGSSTSSSTVVTTLNELPGLMNNYNTYSYAHIDSSWIYHTTSYTQSGIPLTFQIPIASATAGLMSQTKLTNNIWSSSAGYNRGVYKTGTKLVHEVKKTDRDVYFPSAINPILQEKDTLILFGNKTYMPDGAGPLSRIEVRLLMIRIEKTVSALAKQFLFEGNDEATRARFKYLTDQYLAGIKTGGGLSDYKVVVDETNNSPDTINANRLIVNIAVKPIKSINFITLNFDIYDSNMTIAEA